jgi:hypothetical protein
MFQLQIGKGLDLPANPLDRIFLLHIGASQQNAGVTDLTNPATMLASPSHVSGIVPDQRYRVRRRAEAY